MELMGSSHSPEKLIGGGDAWELPSEARGRLSISRALFSVSPWRLSSQQSSWPFEGWRLLT